ncbi:condensation domain-containing protein [Streptomyces ficellus]|uniref:NAD-dependent epimerase/dehydratase family protein n=1 Tax=Streptomyces ficellus TaxID=1977088 RepID=A0A6I6FG66_9ACTN|nr:condensation domain-containing protein [Streptomyces ficellus]QGV82294.1 NAD-dependent epimerase/dehydratase family protein [Streptomyces ficellus]
MSADTPTASALALQEELLRRARRRAGGRSAGTPTEAPAATPADETEADETEADGTDAAGGRGPAPLSRAQRRMWLMDRLGQGAASYNVPFATRLRGPLDVGALGTALTALVRRHEILRTRYVQRDGEPCQEVLPAPDAIGARVVEVAPDRAAGLLAEEARRPFDLSAGPLPRLLVLRHGEEDHTVLLTFHHIAVDGASLEVIASELTRLYASARDGGAAEPLTPPLRYADFARREHEAADRFEEGLRHWARRLEGAVPPPLPGPALPPADAHAQPAQAVSVPLATGVPDALRALGAAHRATLFAVALAAAFATLHRMTGEDDLLIGVAGTHRRGTDMRELVGLCVNTLPVRVDTSGDPAFTVLVERVRDALLEAQHHRDVPFDLVVERLGAAARDAGGTALVRVTADVLGEPTALRLPGAEGTYVDVGVGEAKFDLSFGLLDTAGPAALVQFSRTAVDEAAGRALAEGFAALLTAVAADPGSVLSRLPAVAVTAASPEPASAGTGGGVADRGSNGGKPHPAEELLRAHPGVSEAVAVTAPHASGGGQLLAYAVLADVTGPSRAELRSALRRALAPELVPVTVTLLDAVPRTAQGAPDLSRLPGLPSATATAGPVAEAVTEAFARELGCPAPGPDDDFFVLGGHSLSAVRLAEALRGTVKLPLTGLDILQARTPRAVVALLAGREAERAATATSRDTACTGGAARSRGAARPRGAREGTVLVTGGTGGVGAFVLRELAARGRPVLALARPESAHLVAGEGVDVVEGDLADLDGLRAAVAEADAVIHAACTFTRPEVDVAAMEAMVDAWRRGPFVFVSSVDAYGHPADDDVAEESPSRRPLSPYGQAKLDCERLLLGAAGTAGRGGASAVRSPLVWGAHDRLRDQLRWGATGLLYQAVREGRPLRLPRPGAHGHAWYGAPWVHAAALARAVTSCLDAPVHGVANAVGGHVSWHDLTARLAELLHADGREGLPAGGEGAVPDIHETDEVHPDLDHHWRYRADRLAPSLRERPGEDWRTVLAEMTGPAGT